MNNVPKRTTEIMHLLALLDTQGADYYTLQVRPKRVITTPITWAGDADVEIQRSSIHDIAKTAALIDIIRPAGSEIIVLGNENLTAIFTRWRSLLVRLLIRTSVANELGYVASA